MSSVQFPKTKNDFESYVAPSITLSQTDIEQICKICDIAWKTYFSKPLPGYNSMKVYWKGKVQLFHLLNRDDQLEIIKSAHISNVTSQDIEKQKNESTSNYEKFISDFIGFNEGQLLKWHGIAHSVRTAILTQLACEQYFENFKEFKNMTSRILFCSISASLLHDIGRCFGGDMYDIFGSLSAEIAGQILTQVGGFSDVEINEIKEAIEIGGLNIKDVKTFSKENDDVLNNRQLIACLMGDADSYEFERFYDKLSCKIEFTSVKRLGILTNDGRSPDEILNCLKKDARSLSERISEPDINSSQINHITFLRDELIKLNESTQ